MAKQEKKNLCFVISPIGEDGSEIRRRSDQVLKHIISPAAKDCGYEPIRADKISEPGMITSQVIQHLVDDALVIADLTGRNPNVFYELAIRHAVRKPIVQVIQQGEPIPFDVAQSRTIQVDHHDLDSVARCREDLVKQIHSVENDPTDVDTPISVAIDLQSLRQSENPLEKSSAEIITMLQDLRTKVERSVEIFPILNDMLYGIKELSDVSRRSRMNPMMLNELLFLFDRLASVLQLSENEMPSREKFQEAQKIINKSINFISELPHSKEEEMNIRDFMFRLDRIKKKMSE